MGSHDSYYRQNEAYAEFLARLGGLEGENH